MILQVEDNDDDEDDAGHLILQVEDEDNDDDEDDAGHLILEVDMKMLMRMMPAT